MCVGLHRGRGVARLEPRAARRRPGQGRRRPARQARARGRHPGRSGSRAARAAEPDPIRHGGASFGDGGEAAGGGGRAREPAPHRKRDRRQLDARRRGREHPRGGAAAPSAGDAPAQCLGGRQGRGARPTAAWRQAAADRLQVGLERGARAALKPGPRRAAAHAARRPGRARGRAARARGEPVHKPRDHLDVCAGGHPRRRIRRVPQLHRRCAQAPRDGGGLRHGPPLPADALPAAPPVRAHGGHGEDAVGSPTSSVTWTCSKASSRTSCSGP